DFCQVKGVSDHITQQVLAHIEYYYRSNISANNNLWAALPAHMQLKIVGEATTSKQIRPARIIVKSLFSNMIDDDELLGLLALRLKSIFCVDYLFHKGDYFKAIYVHKSGYCVKYKTYSRHQYRQFLECNASRLRQGKKPLCAEQQLDGTRVLKGDVFGGPYVYVYLYYIFIYVFNICLFCWNKKKKKKKKKKKLLGFRQKTHGEEVDLNKAMCTLKCEDPCEFYVLNESDVVDVISHVYLIDDKERDSLIDAITRRKYCDRNIFVYKNEIKKRSRKKLETTFNLKIGTLPKIIEPLYPLNLRVNENATRLRIYDEEMINRQRIRRKQKRKTKGDTDNKDSNDQPGLTFFLTESISGFPSAFSPFSFSSSFVCFFFAFVIQRVVLICHTFLIDSSYSSYARKIKEKEKSGITNMAPNRRNGLKFMCKFYLFLEHRFDFQITVNRENCRNFIKQAFVKSSAGIEFQKNLVILLKRGKEHWIKQMYDELVKNFCV
ncbi:hypothetical protein RFI_14084, partial [Reticulomyxa filosa]